MFTLRPILVLAVVTGLVAAHPAQAGERLLVPQLPGWQAIDVTGGDGVESYSLIPPGETRDTWTRRLTVQAFRATTMGAEGFLSTVVDRVEEACDGIAAEPVHMNLGGGLDSGLRAIACGRYKGDGKGLFTLYMAVRGHEALYVLARSWRGDPFQAGKTQPVPPSEVERWAKTFDHVRLCGGPGGAPCPPQ